MSSPKSRNASYPTLPSVVRTHLSATEPLRSSPLAFATIIAQAVRSIALTHMTAVDRHAQRQTLLDAYLAQLTSADLRDERMHDSLRALIGLATLLVEKGQIAAAVMLLAQVAPTPVSAEPSALSSPNAAGAR